MLLLTRQLMLQADQRERINGAEGDTLKNIEGITGLSEHIREHQAQNKLQEKWPRKPLSANSWRIPWARI